MADIKTVEKVISGHSGAAVWVIFKEGKPVGVSEKAPTLVADFNVWAERYVPAESAGRQGAEWIPCSVPPKLAGMYLAHHDEHGYDVIPWTGESWGKTEGLGFRRPPSLDAAPLEARGPQVTRLEHALWFCAILECMLKNPRWVVAAVAKLEGIP